MKLPLHLFPQLTEKEMRTLIHMTGSDYDNKEPLWRNYANLSSKDPNMLSMMEKKIVGPPIMAEGYAADAYWKATDYGLDLAEAIFYVANGERQIKNLRRKLEKANVLLNDEGFDHFPEFED